MVLRTAWIALAWCGSAVLPLAAAQYEVAQEDDGVTITREGKPVARYVVNSGGKPIVWPIYGPGGIEMTRQFPMREAAPSEKADHPHHRSLWFTHGDMNGVDFWAEGKGRTLHREFLEVRGGEQAVIRTRNDWVAPDDRRVCQDVRCLTFGSDGKRDWIDFDCRLTATDGDVVFGDTKEGSFGVRVPGTVKVDAKLGGRIVNSEGLVDGEAWGKRAAWCDYHGPVQDKTVGIAILNHPSSFRFPAYWHVRTYGLFAANLWGESDFTKGPKGAGAYTLASGQSLPLHFRVVIHSGDEKEADIASAYAAYAKTSR